MYQHLNHYLEINIRTFWVNYVNYKKGKKYKNNTLFFLSKKYKNKPFFSISKLVWVPILQSNKIQIMLLKLNILFEYILYNYIYIFGLAKTGIPILY